MPASLELKAMVREQLVRGGVRSRRVLGAFLRVDRARFVPPDLSRQAYANGPLAIGAGQTISQPLMVADMLEALDLHRGQRLLEVGAGSGYALALAAALGATAYGVERIPELARAIPGRFAALGLPEPRLRVADGTLGWPDQAPFARILVSAACPKIPPPLLDQLDEEGVLVAPVGDAGGQVLHRVARRGGGFRTDAGIPCIFVPLRGRYGFAGR